MMSMSYGSSAVRAAPISVPAAWFGFLKRYLTCTASRFPALRMASISGYGGDLCLQQILAGLDQEHIDAAFDQSRRLLFVGRQHGVQPIWPREGSFVVGHDPATNLGCLWRKLLRATSPGGCGRFRLISRTLSRRFKSRREPRPSRRRCCLDDVAAYAEKSA